MSFFARIEQILENAVEGTTSRLFRAELQPVQLAKAAARALDARQVIGPDGPEVPNRYRIFLHPADFERFAGYRNSLQAQLERYLDRYAADRGLQPVAAWDVELAVDDSLRPRAIRVEAEMVDVEAPADERDQIGPQEGTAVLPRVSDFAARRGATLVGEDGREFQVVGDITSLGRALDNDVVIADSRVSRYHAQIRRLDGGFAIHDLGSTNGTAVAGKRVTELRLGDGDEISLGGYNIVLLLAGD